MKKSKTKAPTGAACTSTVNTMKCALTGEHDVHCSSSRKLGQYMTWSTLEDGRIQITTYSGKKKQGGWIEDAPQPRTCGNRARHATGELTVGVHAKLCEREPGHDGPHCIGPEGDLEHVVEWEDSAPGWVAYNRNPKGEAATTEPGEPERSSNWWAEWERIGKPEIDVRSVACPTCKVTKGYCKRPSGHKAMNAHAARWDAALLKAARAYEEKHCGGCGVERDKQPHKETCPSPLAALNREQPTKAESAKPTSESVDDRLFALIVAKPGQTAPQLGRRYTKAIARLEAAGRIEWRDEGWYPVEEDPKKKRARKAKPAEAEPVDDGRRCGVVPSKNSRACILDQGHDGRHSNGRQTWSNKPTKAPGEPCNAVALHDDEWVCALRAGHPGAHRSERVPGGSMATWSTNSDGSEDGQIRPIREDGSIGAVTAVGSGGWSRPSDELAKVTSTVTQPEQAPRSVGTKILGYRRHPAAALWPMMEDDDLARLVDSVKARGLEEGDEITLVTINGETWILDGSNRGVACERAGVEPRFVHYRGATDMQTLRDWVDARNDARRHLSKSVRAMIAAAGDRLCRGNPGDRESGRSAGLKSQAERAKAKGVSERLVRKAEAVHDRATPALVEAVMRDRITVEAAEIATRLPAAKQDEIAGEALARKSGEVKGGRVRSLVKQEEKRAIVRTINEQQVPPAPVGSFRLIVADPPWPYENSDQHEGSRGHIPYPAMSLDQICALRTDLDRLAHEKCILGLWITNAFVHELGRVLSAWGFTHRTMLTWPKDRIGLGQWARGQTEHLVIASRGEPPHTLNEITTLLPSGLEVREHSRKPDEVMAMLEKHCPGPRLEMFAREPREKWQSWGAEVQKFAGAA